METRMFSSNFGFRLSLIALVVAIVGIFLPWYANPNASGSALELVGTVGPLLQDTLIDFFAVYLDIGWRLDTDTYLITFYAEYCYGDIITNDKLLSDPSCQNQHGNLPLV